MGRTVSMISPMPVTIFSVPNGDAYLFKLICEAVLKRWLSRRYDVRAQPGALSTAPMSRRNIFAISTIGVAATQALMPGSAATACAEIQPPPLTP